MSSEYDIIIVGAGLIGSAAGRHLVDISNNLKVLLIGPDEPKVAKNYVDFMLLSVLSKRWPCSTLKTAKF